jgi:O-antigen/teichoic acid export membrane protein
MVLGVVSIKILTSMGLQEYGKYALVISLSALLSSVFYGPVEQGFVRYYYDYAAQGMARDFIALFYKVSFLSGSIFFVLTLFATAVSFIFGTYKPVLFIAAAGLFVILWATTNPFNSLLNVLRKRKANAIIQIVERAIAITLLYGIFYFDALTALSVLIVLSIATALMIIVKVRFLDECITHEWVKNQQKTLKYRQEVVNAIGKFSMPFGIWGMANWLQSNSERWIIAKYLSVSDVGIYAVMMAVATYLIAVPYGVIAQFVTPIIYERFSHPLDALKINEGYGLLKCFVVSVMVLMLFSLLLTAIVGREILLQISNNKFVGYWHILPFLCLGTGFFYIGQALTTQGMLLNVPEKYLFPKIASGVIAVIANILCLKLIGLTGIAVSISVTGFIYMIMIIYVNTKLQPVRHAISA